MSEEQVRRVVRNFPENGMKVLLQRGGNVRELLTLAGCELVPRLLFDELAVDPTVYVTADYSHVGSDIVLTVPLRSAKKRKRLLSLTILIEHQSQPERLMLFRVLEYLVQVWRHQAREWEQQHGSRASVKLRPVLPVVFYTGSFRWERLGRLVDLMDEAGAVERFTPQFEPIFVNLPELSAEALHERGGYFGQVLRLVQQRGAKRATFRELLGQVTAAIEGMPREERPRRQEMLSYLEGAVYHYRAAPEHDECFEMIKGSARTDEFRLEVDMVRRTIADVVREEGAVAEGRATLIRQLRQRFGQLPSSVERAIATTNKPDQLRAWLDRVIPAATLADVGITEQS